MTPPEQDKSVPVKIVFDPHDEEQEDEQADQTLTDQTPAEEPAQEQADAAAEPVVVEETDWKARYDEEHEKYLRALADLQNYRRRTEQERAQQLQYAHEALLTDLLPLSDNCNQALASIRDTDEVEDLARGVEMILGQLQAFMQRYGVRELNPHGEPFDPELHEAVEAVPTDEAAPNTVVEVLQPGYMLNDRLLRAPKVRVAVAPRDSSDS
jgi:molecular chaperone GrpE